jgi:hypothetical protein
MSARSRWEVVAVLGTGTLHLVFEEVLNQKAGFLAFAGVGWTVYAVTAVRKDPRILGEWGFSSRGLRESSRAATIVFGIAAAGIAAVAFVRNTFLLTPHLFPILLLYPVWGLVQQFLIQAMVARNIAMLFARPHPVVPVAAVLFAAVHWPDPVLMGATFLLGLAFTPIYLRHRNLWPLGILHGWLGAFVYYWILGRDSWLELLGRAG